jgi:hypothetical protein
MSPSSDLRLAVAAIEVGCQSRPNHVEVEAVYQIKANAEKRSHLTLDLSSVPIKVLSVKSSHAEPVQITKRDHLVVLKLLPDRSWSDAEITITLQWHLFSADHQIKAPPPPLLLVPDSLPRVVGAEESDSQQTAIKINCGQNSKNIIALGVRDEIQDDQYLRAAVFRKEVHTKQQTNGAAVVLITSALESRLAAKERALAQQLIRVMKDFLSDEFAYDPDPDVLIGTASDFGGTRTAVPGPWLITTPQHLGFGAEASRQDAALALQLASVWWGTGCRISGQKGREIEYAIRCAVGLRWASFAVGRDEADRNGVRLQDLTSPVRGSGWKNWLAEGWRPWVGISNGRLLFSALNDNPAARRTLRALTREVWGKTVSHDVVLKRFAVAGIKLDV